MSTLSDFVNVSITSVTSTPTKVGFGTPLVLGYFTAWPDRVRTYSSLSAMVADGIVSTGVGAATYWAAAAIFSQNPRVAKIKVARRTNAWTQKVQLLPTTATAGVVYTFSIGALGGAPQSFIRTVPGASTIAAECAAIKALIDAAAISGLTTVVGGGNTYVECTSTVPGTMFVYSGRNPELQLFESTAAPAGISTDLDSVRALDDDWYGFTLDSTSKAEAPLAAAWTEAQLKIFFVSTGDSENGTIGASGTLLKLLKASAYFRTSTWFDSAAVPSFIGAGIMGEELPYPPGTSIYALKTIAAVTVDLISATVDGEVKAQNGNTYTTVAGKNVTAKGVSAAGEFIDIAVGRDFLQARTKEAVFGVLSGVRRVAYTNAGIATITDAIQGVWNRAQGTVDNPGFLDPEVPVVVTAPLVKDISTSDRASRVLNNVTVGAKVAGAIIATNIAGTITV